MHLTNPLLLLATLSATSLAIPTNIKRQVTSSTPISSPSSSSSSSSSSDGYSTAGFGSNTASSGSDITYKGNVGSPWGSNIIEVSSSAASSYKHVLEITGPDSEAWSVVFWNKYGPDGQMNGWYGYSALNLDVEAGETKYVALADDTNGGFAAAPSSSEIPKDNGGGYAATWGEFDFSSAGNGGWSGFDVSAIAAQNAGLDVQGMSICEQGSGTCSSITTDAGSVDNAYTTAETDIGGIGGNISGDGQVILTVTLGYDG
ncbi:hypothetical protein P170DRAFT_359096 [Aspergillus steynii IBT 23096]|uniref:Allergen n=1 Tax=Aspergillus steynii IBT 23096 TaxID=1392250 RepID=A0A2I2GA72_9EURO|nr:uncharacterized protein P170DRAFT_359096 [Aspergillus steynii IBT 23096]PLB49774.1 hypothetical protein P170DRAFT_359096 [Aspergillus steynii IBT 23096]